MSEELDNEMSDIPVPSGGNLLAPVETDLTFLDENSPTDELLRVFEAIKFYQENLKKFKAKIEEVLVARIKRDGDINLGNGVRHYIGHPKTTKCTDLPGAVEAILTACGGDFKTFCGILSANAIKPGAAKGVLDPEAFNRFFETKVKDKLEDGTPIAPSLQKFDERWVKPRAKRLQDKPAIVVPEVVEGKLPF